jgi:predicted flavoprotein YhiN
MYDVCIIGGGPAGLMAAEIAADNKLSVVIVDAMPTYGRKFLMAGKSGLNITKNQNKQDFLSKYYNAEHWLTPIINNFDNKAVMNWAQNLGQEIFTGSSGHVFPKTMKASPLLRAWLQRLANKGIKFYHNWKWIGWEKNLNSFDTKGGKEFIKSHTTILALGGASWSKLGSNGLWADILKNHGHKIIGEFIISKKGIEGSGIYAASKFMRDGHKLMIDLLPGTNINALNEREKLLPKKASKSTFIRKVLRLNKEKTALFNEFSQNISKQDISITSKNLLIPHDGPCPIDEAISTAGGVPKNALDHNLMLKSMPGIFCAGEMLDWEAPTGGYLITACLATGVWAGLGATNYIRKQS